MASAAFRSIQASDIDIVVRGICANFDLSTAQFSFICLHSHYWLVLCYAPFSRGRYTTSFPLHPHLESLRVWQQYSHPSSLTCMKVRNRLGKIIEDTNLSLAFFRLRLGLSFS